MATSLGPGMHAAAGEPVDGFAYERWTGRWSRLFVPAVVAAAGVVPGDVVLDVSTGTGEAALYLAENVGPSGRVVGVDIAPAMLAAARTRLAHQVFWPVAADGQELPFRTASFDALVCQLGLQFFPDPAKGLAEFRRVLRAGGGAAICVISTPDRAPMWGIVAEELARLVPHQESLLRLSFSLSDPTQLRSLFTDAGFQHVTVERFDRQDSVESFSAYWRALENGVGSMPQIYRRLSTADRARARQRVEIRLSRFLAVGQLVMSVEMLIASGRA